MAVRAAVGRASEESIDRVIGQIRDGIGLRGTGMWLLLCSALIASIGLNTSSVAVIIGGMLISPLMGPILGIGLGLGISDREMLFRAVRWFCAASAMSLAASSLYFLVTPITSPTAELLSRTNPTILDACIAFFGGIAGIIAGLRPGGSTAIPGVAIATALMPPLCTAGYGLASGHWKYFWGAFYLFFLNAVIISVATYLVARLMRFPQNEHVHDSANRRVGRLIGIVVILVIVPSVVIFNDIITTLRLQTSAEDFVRRELERNGRTVLSWKYGERDSVSMLRVYMSGPPIDSVTADSLNALLPERGLPNSQLLLVQLGRIPEKSHIGADELLGLLQSQELQQRLVESLSAVGLVAARTDSTPVDTLSIAVIAREMHVAFPTLLDISYAPELRRAADTVDGTPEFLIRLRSGLNRRERERERSRMSEFLKVRLGRDTVRVLDITLAPSRN